MARGGKQTVLQGAIILTASTMVVKGIGALFKIPLANILGGVGMSYFVSAYDVLITIYSMTVTGMGVAVSRMVSERSGYVSTAAEDILKTAKTLFWGSAWRLPCCFFVLPSRLPRQSGTPQPIFRSAALRLLFYSPVCHRPTADISRENTICCLRPARRFWRLWSNWFLVFRSHGSFAKS